MSFIEAFSLQGKQALVTGGAMGIGRRCATAVAAAGANAAIVDLNKRLDYKRLPQSRQWALMPFLCIVMLPKKNRCKL